MVAEPVVEVPTEKIVKYFLQTEFDPDIYYGYNRGASRGQIVITHVGGTNEDTTIQHDIWGVDKESALQTTLDLVLIYRQVANYDTPFGRIMGAEPVSYLWRPDEEYARYVLDVRIITTP